jgi:hypothetical protein
MCLELGEWVGDSITTTTTIIMVASYRPRIDFGTERILTFRTYASGD